MDFKARINSCGRFSTDENFKKIIMKNSCRLRQSSAFNQKEIYMNTDSTNDEQNNIKIFKRKSYNDIDLPKQNLEKKGETKKDKKYHRYISDKININKKNDIKPTSSSLLFFYQDIRALKLYKNNQNINNIIYKDDSIKAFNEDNKTNDNNFTKIKNNSVDKEENKSNTLFIDSKKNRRNFLLKRIKQDLHKNLITNEKKIKIDLLQKQINNTVLNNSLYLKDKNKVNDAFSTEINNNPYKRLTHHITKDNYNLYKKPNKLNHARNKYSHNSISLFPAEIPINHQNLYNNKNIRKEEKDNENRKISRSSSELDLNIEKEDNFINYFFCELIDLSNGMEEKSLFDILINNLNKKYIFNYKQKTFPITSNKFIYVFRFFCALVTPLLFLSKDYDLYKYSSVKGRLFINQFIYSSLSYIGENNFNIPKIKNFLKKYSGTKKISMMNCTSSFIKLVFSEKIEYKPLKKALLQLITNILNESVDNIIKILNDTILFCFNNRAKERMYYHPFHRKKSQVQLEENSKISESSPSIPFIKSSMKKDFCLVLDIDETISHSLKLSFGYYFLLRPGAIDFLNELSNYYEIDIFTSSLRLYADFIIDKIDTNGNLISYRLYKNHVTYEKGKSVKKLNMIGRDLNKIIFVDNLKSNAKYNLKNLCHISSWTNDIYDKELIKLKNKLKYIATSGKYNDDITKGIK